MPEERNFLRDSLGPTKDCPPLEKLEAALSGSDKRIVEHVRSCRYCETELAMLRTFTLADVPAEESAAVREVALRLAAPRKPVLRGSERLPWWRFGGSLLRPAVLGFAALLLLAGVGLQLRNSGRPQLRTDVGSDVYRTNTLTVLAPSGDLQQPPDEVRWKPVPAAVRYRVRILEVDGNEMWSVESAGGGVTIPADVRARIVPAKTLLCSVTALDGDGRTVAESNNVRFRVLQTVYPR